MKRRFFAFLIACVVSPFGLTCAADWPTYMHDNTRVGYTPDTIKLPLTEAWVRASATPPKWAWPGPGGKVIEGLKLEHRVRFDDVFHVAVVGDSVYYGSSVDNTVYCVAADTGETRWQFVTSGPVRLAPTVADGRVLVGSDDGNVYSLDAESGQLIWQLRAGPRDERILARGRMASRWPVRTGVLVDQGIVYFGAGVFPHETVYLYAVRADTGDIIWKNDRISQRDAGRDDLTPQGYLLATQDRLFVPSGRTLPAAFDRRTGEKLHKQLGGGKQVGGTQALLDEDDILSVGEHHILALDQRGGSIDNRLRGRCITLRENMAYIADGEHITAIDRPQYAQVQEQRLKFEAQLADIQRRLRGSRAPIYLERVREAQAAVEQSEQLVRQLADSDKQDSDEFRAAESELASLKQSLVTAAETYETSRKAHESWVEQAGQKQDQILELTTHAIRWRTESPLESTMILTGDLLVVGGPGRVSLLDVETGDIRGSHAVEAEVRGLACADGRLYVSTTAGRIYCFSDANHRPVQPRVRNTASTVEPFPKDELTDRYATAADEIIQRSGVKRGYCLVIGSDQGRLAYELAKRTSLNVYCVEADANKVAQSRAAIASTGLYGHRITVDHVDLAAYPHPNYFANLIVCDSLLLDGLVPGDPIQVARHLKPAGGAICLGVPSSAPEDIQRRAAEAIPAWMRETKLELENANIESANGWTWLTRNVLTGTAGWTHQYGNPGNTSSIQDDRVRGGLRVLWYGDPGPSAMTNRHAGAVGPVSAAGRLFVQGDRSVMAYDAFNGGFLWEQYNPDALRTGVFNNYESGNLVATSDSLFMVIKDKCLHMDAATGQIVRTYEIPNGSDDESHQWGFVAHDNGRLYGTSTVRELVAEEARRRGRPAEADNTDQIFAIDVASGQQIWTHQGQSISHTTIAIDRDRLYFVDSSLTQEQREELLRQDKTELEKLTGDARQLAEDRLKRMDARRAVALDAATGEALWSTAVDVTDCTGVGIGAGRLTVMASDGHVVLCGANANGHYWKQFLAGEFKRRRLVVLSAETGEKLWARDANYRHRPIVVGNRLIAEPWAYDLASGQQLTRKHPLTGEETPWKFIRPGHHCGAISATPNLMFFRSGFTAYYDFDLDSGTRHFAGHRLGCWINTIPANGLVMIPEASAGCACLFSLTSTIVFEPLEDRQVWSVYTAEGATKPVQHMALNLGTPGDRRDAHGKLWLSYPRPSSRPGLDLPLEIGPLSPFGVSGSYFQHNAESYVIEGTDVPWLYSSGMTGVTRCGLPLIAAEQPAAKYRVRLHFAAFDADQPGQRVFDVRLQSKAVSRGVDVLQKAGGPRRALTLEFDDVAVTRDLIVELVPRSGAARESNLPVLCAIEVLRTGAGEIVQTVAGQ